LLASTWFTEVVEPLADKFDAAAVEEYVQLFTDVLARAHPEYEARVLRDRYQRVRGAREFSGPDPDRVFVLSRVTLGADVAITSVALDGVKRRFPKARICFAGSRKAWELFAADPRVEHCPAPYNRAGSLDDRLASSRALANLIDEPGSIVIDPDSRLTQLGLVPVCPEERYFFFESRASGAPGSLTELMARWLDATFGVSGARPYIAPERVHGLDADITVSLGVGGNQKKRVRDPFERELIKMLAESGRSILVDEGGGGEECERVGRAIANLSNVRTWNGAFAPFAAGIAGSKLYAGYDSAGQHVAAASGVPLIAIFAGFPNERFFERWRPSGSARMEVIRADSPDPGKILEDVHSALARMNL
jgi:ADP-heptose:LPS heptosyltransferase